MPYEIMKKLVITNAKEMSKAIRNAISCSEESSYDHRLHGILLVSEGMICYDTGSILGENPNENNGKVGKRIQRERF